MVPDCTILIGDARDRLRWLRGAIDCGQIARPRVCVTSPPYWGLRDYGTPPQVWGGKKTCAHQWSAPGKRHRGGPGGVSLVREGRDNSARDEVKDVSTGRFCARCNAWVGELGHEPTVELYVRHVVEVFDLLWDVLADDGTLWLNMGDCYAGGGNGGGGSFAKDRIHLADKRVAGRTGSRGVGGVLKEKDLVGQPWLVAFALQARGWWLRQDNVWHKPNPMPESVTDRTTRAHEYIFHLSKAERYYYDAEAIKEKASPNSHARISQAALEVYSGNSKHADYLAGTPPAGKKSRDRASGEILAAMGRKLAPARSGIKSNTSVSEEFQLPTLMANKRSVWTVPTQPYREAHYATFPPALVKPCILAGSAVGDTVIDIFGGSGTVGQVALEFGRHAILIDLNPANASLMRDRTARHHGQSLMVPMLDTPKEAIA